MHQYNCTKRKELLSMLTPVRLNALFNSTARECSVASRQQCRGQSPRLQHGAKDRGLEIQWTKVSSEHPALYVLLTDSSLFFFSYFIANTNAPSPTPVGINTTIPINHNSCLLEALCDLEKWKGSLKCWNRKPFDHKPPSYIPLHDEKQ